MARSRPRDLVTLYGALASGLALWGARAGDRGVVSWAANATAFWWLAPALGGVLEGARRRRVLPVLACAGAAWRWVGLFGRPLLPRAARGDSRATVRIATLNVLISTDRLKQIRELVDRDRPDILVLQEIVPAVRDRLPTELPELAHWAFTDARAGDRIADVCCVASRFPVTSTRPVPGTPPQARPTLVVTLDVGGVAVQVVPVHLLAPQERSDARGLRQLAAQPALRRSEVAAALAALRPGSAIVAGDCNSSDANDPRRQLLAAGFCDAHAVAGSGFGFTWPRRGLFRIDWIFTRGLRPVRSWVGPAGASDHRPVVADVELPSSAALPTSRQNATASRS